MSSSSRFASREAIEEKIKEYRELIKSIHATAIDKKSSSSMSRRKYYSVPPPKKRSDGNSGRSSKAGGFDRVTASARSVSTGGEKKWLPKGDSRLNTMSVCGVGLMPKPSPSRIGEDFGRTTGGRTIVNRSARTVISTRRGGMESVRKVTMVTSDSRQSSGPLQLLSNSEPSFVLPLLKETSTTTSYLMTTLPSAEEFALPTVPRNSPSASQGDDILVTEETTVSSSTVYESSGFLYSHCSADSVHSQPPELIPLEQDGGSSGGVLSSVLTPLSLERTDFGTGAATPGSPVESVLSTELRDWVLRQQETMFSEEGVMDASLDTVEGGMSGDPLDSMLDTVDGVSDDPNVDFSLREPPYILQDPSDEPYVEFSLRDPSYILQDPSDEPCVEFRLGSSLSNEDSVNIRLLDTPVDVPVEMASVAALGEVSVLPTDIAEESSGPDTAIDIPEEFRVHDTSTDIEFQVQESSTSEIPAEFKLQELSVEASGNFTLRAVSDENSADIGVHETSIDCPAEFRVQEASIDANVRSERQEPIVGASEQLEEMRFVEFKLEGAKSETLPAQGQSDALPPEAKSNRPEEVAEVSLSAELTLMVRPSEVVQLWTPSNGP